MTRNVVIQIETTDVRLFDKDDVEATETAEATVAAKQTKLSETPHTLLSQAGPMTRSRVAALQAQTDKLETDATPSAVAL